MSELVHLQITDHIARITLDSPHNRNALSRQLVSELHAHLQTVNESADVGVVVLQSADQVFCSGADLKEAASADMAEGTRGIIALLRQIVASPKPFVVRLAGPVRAGGLGIVGAADIVIAAESVSFALTEVRLALAPAMISLTLLPRLAPRAAADIFLSGRSFDASEAAAMGLITRAVPDADLDAAIADAVAELAQGYPQGLSETKQLLNREMIARIDVDGERLATRSAELFNSEQAREAMLAFLQRKPR